MVGFQFHFNWRGKNRRRKKGINTTYPHKLNEKITLGENPRDFGQNRHMLKFHLNEYYNLLL